MSPSDVAMYCHLDLRVFRHLWPRCEHAQSRTRRSQALRSCPGKLQAVLLLELGLTARTVSGQSEQSIATWPLEACQIVKGAPPPLAAVFRVQPVRYR